MLGVVTALLTCIAAAFGVFAANKSDQASAQGVVATSVASSASVAQNEADGTIQSLESANSLLNGQLSTRPTVTVTATASNPATAATNSGGAPAASTQEPIYDEATLQVNLDGCDRGDDIDLDVPEHPALESAAEVDFNSCLQGGEVFIVGKNGAVISKAAPPTANQAQCLQAVKEEPAGSNGIALAPGQVICVAHYNKDGQRHVFRLLVQQFVPQSPIILSVSGWQ